MSFDLNILVNGNRCKQHYFQGKTFIEAKNGSEYVIEIKNNHYKRVLAVTSVDGLNVLTGKKASDKDSGYIVGAYSNERIKGFRYSDDSWAMFRFGYKFDGNTYAQSKNDGSEQNCGIVGMKVFYENEPVYTYTAPPPPVIWNTTPPWLQPSTTVIINNPPNYAVTASYSCGSNVSGGAHWNVSSVSSAYCPPGTGAYQSNVNYTCNTLGQVSSANAGTSYTSPGVSTRVNDQSLLKEAIADAKAVRQTALANAKSADKFLGRMKKLSGTKSSAGGCSGDVTSDRASLRDRFNRVRSTATNTYTRDFDMEADRSLGFMEQPKAEFDMGTEWGRKEYSRVHNVTFDRGCLAQSFDIYYASREALIAMGVPLSNELATNLPQSFPNGYAQPPVGWQG